MIARISKMMIEKWIKDHRSMIFDPFFNHHFADSLLSMMKDQIVYNVMESFEINFPRLFFTTFDLSWCRVDLHLFS